MPVPVLGMGNLEMDPTCYQPQEGSQSSKRNKQIIQLQCNVGSSAQKGKPEEDLLTAVADITN